MFSLPAAGEKYKTMVGVGLETILQASKVRGGGGAGGEVQALIVVSSSIGSIGCRAGLEGYVKTGYAREYLSGVPFCYEVPVSMHLALLDSNIYAVYTDGYAVSTTYVVPYMECMFCMFSFVCMCCVRHVAFCFFLGQASAAPWELSPCFVLL